MWTARGATPRAWTRPATGEDRTFQLFRLRCSTGSTNSASTSCLTSTPAAHGRLACRPRQSRRPILSMSSPRLLAHGHRSDWRRLSKSLATGSSSFHGGSTVRVPGIKQDERLSTYGTTSLGGHLWMTLNPTSCAPSCGGWSSRTQPTVSWSFHGANGPNLPDSQNCPHRRMFSSGQSTRASHPSAIDATILCTQ